MLYEVITIRRGRQRLANPLAVAGRGRHVADGTGELAVLAASDAPAAVAGVLGRTGGERAVHQRIERLDRRHRSRGLVHGGMADGVGEAQGAGQRIPFDAAAWPVPNMLGYILLMTWLRLLVCLKPSILV